MAITRAQQFRQMLEDGGMLVSPSRDGRRPGYRRSNYGPQGETKDRGFKGGKPPSSKKDDPSPQDNRVAAATDIKSLQKAYGVSKKGLTEDQKRRRDEAKASRKITTQRLRPESGLSKIISSGGPTLTFLRNLTNSQFNLNRKKNFMRDLDALSKRFQTRRNINLPFNLGSFDANARINNNLLQSLLNEAKEELGITTGTFQGPGPFNFKDLPISLSDLPKDKQEEIYDKVMDARMSGQTDAAGNLKAGFMFDSQGNIISTGNDGRDSVESDLEQRLRLLEEQNAALKNTTPTTTDSPLGGLGLRFLAEGGRAGFRQAGIAGREYDKADTATKEAISREQDRGATPTSEEFRDQARDIRRREIPKIVKQAAGAVSLLTPIGQIEEARKFKKFLQMKRALDLGKNIKDIYTPLPAEDEDETIGLPSLDIENIRQNPYENLPGPNLRADVSAMDIRRKGQLQSVDYETAKDIGMINPTMTKEEFEGVKSGEITEPTGQFAKEGGRIGAMEGGIMDLESGRQMYFLGKLVKKATRAVKKIAKSPIGKAALFAGLAGAAGFGPLSGLKGKLFGTAMKSGFAGPGIPGLFTKLGLTKTAGSFMPTLKGGIALASLLPMLGLGTGDEDEDEAQEILRGSGLDIASIRNNPYTFRSSVGEGRGLATAFLAEGGKAEPVAKETMPLLKMGGKEMDLRDNGGFVPIGRMERADDVPARLSKNEFVFTADAVRNAGGGDIDKGAEVMYNMMQNLESGGEVSEESQGLKGAREMFQTSKRLEEVL